jgi:hypothetical protein
MSNQASIWAASIGFCLYFGLVALALRLWPERPAHLAVGLGVIVYPIALLAALFVGYTIFFWSFTAVYGSLTLTFLMAFGAIYKSISFRILLDLYNAPGRTEPYDTVLARLIRSESFGRRLEVMKESGFVDVNSGRFTLRPAGARIAGLVGFLQRIFGIKRSG